MVETVIVGGQIRGLRGNDMATASIEASGPNAERLAGELQAALVPPGH
jgi:hypothetical protein